MYEDYFVLFLAICDNPGCVHGRCVAPETCDCSDSGYTNSSGGCNVGKENKAKFSFVH